MRGDQETIATAGGGVCHGIRGLFLAVGTKYGFKDFGGDVVSLAPSSNCSWCTCGSLLKRLLMVMLMHEGLIADEVVVTLMEWPCSLKKIET